MGFWKYVRGRIGCGVTVCEVCGEKHHTRYCRWVDAAGRKTGTIKKVCAGCVAKVEG